MSAFMFGSIRLSGGFRSMRAVPASLMVYNPWATGRPISQAGTLAHDRWRLRVPLGFAAILLVCLATLPQQQCDETTAIELRSIVVDNELGCATGWQELLARAPDRPPGEPPTYLKTVCRRIKPQP